MIRRRTAAFACLVVTIAALGACSQKSPSGRSALTTAGSGAPIPGVTLSPGGTPPVTSSAGAGHTTGNGSPPTSKTTHPPKHSPSPSAGPDDIDYGVAWSNAYCRWVVYSNGEASFEATMFVSASVKSSDSTSGTLNINFTNNGGISPVLYAGSPSKYPPPVDTITFVSTDDAVDFQSHSITYTATLQFTSSVPDQLAGDNVAMLLVHFPPTLPAVGTSENLVCSHVYN
jgi:hypothetical protein